MKFNVSKNEIDSLISNLNLDEGSSLNTLRDNVTIDRGVNFKKKLLVGNVEISFTLSNSNGEIILTITNASIAGLGIFGVVRKKAGEMIVEAINTHSGLVAVKEEGLVKISIPDFNVSFIGIVNDTLHLEMQTK